MSLVGLVAMNPLAAMSMIDISRFRPIIYADTPACQAAYLRFTQEKRGDGRKAVLFLLGAANLPKVVKERDRFSSVLIFDTVQDLTVLGTHLKELTLADVDASGELSVPKHLTPGELADLLETEGSIPDPLPLLSKVTNALGRRRPSVLENTSRIPAPDLPESTGAQRMLNDLKDCLGDEDVSFSVVLDIYVKYLFRIVERSKVTTTVTKKLPAEAREIWSQALEFADSPIGNSFAVAYAKLCRSADADYKIANAVNDFDLKNYSGDFLYFTSLLPPHRGCAFVPAFNPGKDESSLPLVQTFKAPAIKPSTKKSKAKKARSGR